MSKKTNGTGKTTRSAAVLLMLLPFVSACQKKEAEVAADAPAPAQAAEPAKAARPANPVDWKRIANADSEPQNWLTTGRNYGDQRYSPLAQINDQNVSKLGLAWSFDLDIPRGVEATPLVVDGVMYTTEAYSVVYALDARTGKLLWKYDPEVPRRKAKNACCDVVNRGVAFSHGKVYVETIDGRLIALDAGTGKKIWSVDASDGSGRTFALTSAPLAIKDLVLTGSSGAEYNTRGFISAFNAETGKLAWRFYTVPGDPSKPFENSGLDIAQKTWTGKKYWTQGGGGTVWNSVSYDPELDLIYFGTGNAVPWNKLERDEPTGDNLFTSSILALKASSGEHVWHYQETPNDMWDYDSDANITLADVEIDGKPRKLLFHAPKNGFFYVIDRTDGTLISAEKFGIANWATHVDMKTGRPVVDEKAADWTHEPKLVSPGLFGAHNWQPMSYSPQTGLVYIPAQKVAAMMVPRNDQPFVNQEGVWNLGVSLPLPTDRDQLKQAIDSLSGSLLAWDPLTQRKVWSVPYDNVWNGGTLATGGNLVFQGTADGRFVAYSADKGEKLWEVQADTGVMAGPMTYEIGGEQYVTVMAGWGGVFPLSSGAISNNAKVRPEPRVLTYKIGGTASLPPARHEAQALPALPELTGDEETVAQGADLYARNCAACHGVNAVSGGVLPDLRYLQPEVHKTFASVVAGARMDSGMPSFAGLLTDDQIEAVHQYVVKRAHDLEAQITAQKTASAAQ